MNDMVVAEIVSTNRDDGDFRVPVLGDPPTGELLERHRRVHPEPITWLRQVHGAEVVRVTTPGEHAGAQADAVVTSALGCPIAVTTADCAPVVLVSSSGIAVIHAGWKGALSGIVEASARLLLDAGGAPEMSILGPCISASQYEFGHADLDELAAAYGPAVTGTTTEGDPALDMEALIGSACSRAGWPAPHASACTSDPSFFSHRVRADPGRQTTVAWLRKRNTTTEV